MRRVASMPFIIGIWMSMMMMSGKCSRARSTASLPFVASAQMFQCDRAASRLRRPCRTIVWSSASRSLSGLLLRFIQRNKCLHNGPRRPFLDFQMTAELLQAASHPGDADAEGNNLIVSGNRFIKPDSIIFNLQLNPFPGAGKRHTRRRGVRVAVDISETFLHHSEQRRFN